MQEQRKILSSTTPKAFTSIKITKTNIYKHNQKPKGAMKMKRSAKTARQIKMLSLLLTLVLLLTNVFGAVATEQPLSEENRQIQEQDEFTLFTPDDPLEYMQDILHVNTPEPLNCFPKTSRRRISFCTVSKVFGEMMAG